jgi:release factor glutamine methyltransferase
MKEHSGTVPVQYEEGKAAFMGLDIPVDERVFIPRPETELLVSVTEDLLSRNAPAGPFVLDLCTGSGAIAIALAKRLPGCRVIGADVSEDALAVARENIRDLGVQDKIKLVRSDMFSAFLPGREGMFDAIVSNPPYVSSGDYEKLDAWVRAEPRIALHAGDDGMDRLNVLAEQSGRFLKKGAFLAVEIGYDQSKKVKDAFRRNGLNDIRSYKDFNGHERVIAVVKHG